MKNVAKWKTTKETAELLGCSTKHLLRLKDAGILIVKKHWKDLGLGRKKRPTYRWNYDRIKKIL